MVGPSANDPLIRTGGPELHEVTTDKNIVNANTPVTVKSNKKNPERFILYPTVNDDQKKEFEKRVSCIEFKSPDHFRTNQESLNTLIKVGLQFDYIDSKWYGWEAIHYAAYSCDSNMLGGIVDKLNSSGDTDKINTLTVLSENALHILLEHGKVAQSFDISCQNGQELKMAKIINQEQEAVVKCAEILINAKINVNHNNFWNETPILIAIKRKYYKVIKLLTQVKGIDLDSCRGAISGKTARELLKERMLPKSVGTVCPEKTLFQLLKSGDEEAFLKSNSSKIRRFLDSLDGDNEENSSCTLLQYCFRRGLIAWHQEKMSLDCDFQFFPQDITANRIVQVFCQNGMAKCIQHLLDNGANIDFTLRKFENGRTLLEVAIIKSYYPLVALILARKDFSLDSNKILKMCCNMNELLKDSTNMNDVNNTINLVLNRLLTMEKPFGSTEIVDSLMTLLEKGVKILNKENLLLLLRIPSSLRRNKIVTTKKWFHSSVTTKSILEEIDPDVLKTHLDECIEQKEEKIHINYESFVKNNSVQAVLETFLNSPPLHDYLGHPVFKILIMRKWDQLHLKWLRKWKYFYLNLCFHLFFYFILNIYILCKFNNDSATPIFYIMCIFCWIIFVLKEIFQLLADFCLYITEKNNWAEILFIIFTFMVYLSDGEWVDAFAVLSVLSSNLVLLLLLQQVPELAKYIIILQTIVYYLSYIIFYFIQFLAFAICFYILFSKSNQVFYKDFPDKIFETVILFSGNLDYMKTPWKEDDNTTDTLYHNFEYKEVFSKIIFIIFVFFLAIILQNLLLGLLVTDLSGLHKTVKLYVQKARASFVVRLNKFFESPCMKFVPQILKYSKIDDCIDVIVDDSDRKALDDEDKQNLGFILSKKGKRVNNLKKLYGYIRTKSNERTCEIRYDINKDVLEKLELIEERLKYFSDMK